mgnify:CR=1 FL=1
MEKSLFGLQGEYFVNQFHNNTISKEDLAPSLKEVAIDSIYGGVEACIHRKFPILGIQWHPDRKSPDPKFNKELISMFLKAKSWNNPARKPAIIAVNLPYIIAKTVIYTKIISA